jgi:hypothetical protein
MRFDFFVTTDHDQAQAIKEQDYNKNSVVCASASICLEHPKTFHLIPYHPDVDPMALPIYLAVFDGHREIFLFGYSKDTPVGRQGWERSVDAVIKAYADVKFYFVGTEHNLPEIWRYNSNIDQMDFRKFVTYCDV